MGLVALIIAGVRGSRADQARSEAMMKGDYLAQAHKHPEGRWDRLRSWLGEHLDRFGKAPPPKEPNSDDDEPVPGMDLRD